METSMGGPLKPGVQSMTKLSARGKFWIVALPLLLTVLMLTVLHVSRLGRQARVKWSFSALVQYQERIKLGFGADAYVAKFAPP